MLDAQGGGIPGTTSRRHHFWIQEIFERHARLLGEAKGDVSLGNPVSAEVLRERVVRDAEPLGDLDLRHRTRLRVNVIPQCLKP